MKCSKSYAFVSRFKYFLPVISSHYPFHPTSAMIEMMLQQQPEDRPTADQLLKLPTLKPHIQYYEQMALQLIDAKRGQKTPAVCKQLKFLFLLLFMNNTQQNDRL